MPNLNLSSTAADTLFGVFNVIVIVGAALAFVGTIGTIWTSGVRERYSDLRTSNNESKTAIAGRDAARANAEAAKANLRAAEVEKQNIELRQKFANRRIDERQHEILVNALSKYPGVFDIQVMSDPESGMYAADILKTLTDSGWKVDGKTFPLGEIWTGLIVFQTDDPAVNVIANALNAAGIPFAVGDRKTAKATIMVGGKPPVF